MGVWVFVTVEREDVEYKSDQDNLTIADFIFLSFPKRCLVVSGHNVLPRYLDECECQSSRCETCTYCFFLFMERDEQLRPTFAFSMFAW